MNVTALELMGGAVLGGLLGLAYLALLERGVTRVLRQGGAAGAVSLGSWVSLAGARFLLVGAGLWACAQRGAPALLAALLGFLAVRTAVTRRVGRALP